MRGKRSFAIAEGGRVKNLRGHQRGSFSISSPTHINHLDGRPTHEITPNQVEKHLKLAI